MKQKPDRTSTAGNRYLDLRKLARSTQRPTDELLQLYALEGFLDRLNLSAHANDFVLKGGMLLSDTTPESFKDLLEEIFRTYDPILKPLITASSND